MAISFCVLGVYNMANGLRPVAEILEDVWKELKELNDRFDERERLNGRPILPASNAAIARDGNKTTGENK
jgi:hypothetical protein